ncbi:hypothetical protein N9L68_01060 [bacterium]|nr:hypothetical protein [bacterium]
MFDVAYFIGSTETIIPGHQITCLNLPMEQATYTGQQSSRVLHLFLPSSSGGSDVAVNVGDHTYPAGSFDQITHHYSAASQVGRNMNIYPSIRNTFQDTGSAYITTQSRTLLKLQRFNLMAKHWVRRR